MKDQRVGKKYRNKRKIGDGSFGEVYIVASNFDIDDSDDLMETRYKFGSVAKIAIMLQNSPIIVMFSRSASRGEA